jgi:hypothetical protein
VAGWDARHPASESLRTASANVRRSLDSGRMPNEEPTRDISVTTTGTVFTGGTVDILNQPAPAARSRRIFVAYPYSLPKRDYRRPFTELQKAFDVEFQFADERITNRHILDKITEMIVTARFSLFDITTWNANVALELGIAMGRGRDYYLLFNPTHDPDTGQVPADLGGLDRIEYKSFAGLEEGLTKLLAQEFGVTREPERDDPVRHLREQVPGVLDAEPGLKIGEIADRLHIPVEVAKVVVRPLVASGELESTGVKKGMRYYLRDAAPKRAAATGRIRLSSRAQGHAVKRS